MRSAFRDWLAPVNIGKVLKWSFMSGGTTRLKLLRANINFLRTYNSEGPWVKYFFSASCSVLNIDDLFENS